MSSAILEHNAESMWLMMRNAVTFRLKLREHAVGWDLHTFRDGHLVKLQHFLRCDSAVTHADAVRQRMLSEGWSLVTG